MLQTLNVPTGVWGLLLLGKGIVMFKKIIKWTPIVCIVLFVVMFIGMTQAHCVTEGVNAYCDTTLWASDGAHFGASDILAMFGHVNGMHLLGNAVALLLFAVPAELLLGRRKFIAGVALAMLVQVVTSEILHSEGLGASGWLMAMPGLMFGASMWRIWHEGMDSGYMSVPTGLFSAGGLLCLLDISTVGVYDGTDHVAHIIGFVSGLVFVIAGIPFLAMTILEEFRAWQRKRAWKKNRQNWAVR